MAALPPRPPGPAGGEGEPARDPRGGAGSAWRTASGRAWRRLRALPGWAQLLLWMAAWPVTAAVYVARSRRLGPLAAPLTVAVLLVGGPLWWQILTGDGTSAPQAGASAQRWTAPAVAGFGTAAFADVVSAAGDLPEFDPDTLEVDIVGCVQTRSRSTVRDATIRQPRVVVQVTNLGPERTVVVQGAVLLEGYGWNGGWKPTGERDLRLATGQTGEVTLLTDYRHQSSYSPDGLHACRLIDLHVLAPQVWPDHPARLPLPVEGGVVTGGERDFDPRRDLERTDAR